MRKADSLYPVVSKSLGHQLITPIVELLKLNSDKLTDPVGHHKFNFIVLETTLCSGAPK